MPFVPLIDAPNRRSSWCVVLIDFGVSDHNRLWMMSPNRRRIARHLTDREAPSLFSFPNLLRSHRRITPALGQTSAIHLSKMAHFPAMLKLTLSFSARKQTPFVDVTHAGSFTAPSPNVHQSAVRAQLMAEEYIQFCLDLMSCQKCGKWVRIGQ